MISCDQAIESCDQAMMLCEFSNLVEDFLGLYRPECRLVTLVGHAI